MAYETLAAIGTTPSEELCAQVGQDCYSELSRLEIRLYRDLLIEELVKQFPDVGVQIRLKTSSNSHDFGTYHELDVVYDPENPVSVDQAYWCESAPIMFWPEEQRAKINEVRSKYSLNPI
jgi:hypothetical protein